MSTKPVLEQARDILLEILRYRTVNDSIDLRGADMYLSEAWCLERANNGATALLHLLCDPNDSRASIVSGEIRSRYYFDDRPAPTDDDERIK